jgi:hypothetical protein
MKFVKKDFYLKRWWIPVGASIAIIWVSLIPLSFLPDIEFIPEDKIGHFLAFLVLGLLYLWALDNNNGNKKNGYRKEWITFLITSFIGGIIEILQHYLPMNRIGDWFDFFFDIGGILIAIIIYPMLKQKLLNRYGLMLFFFITIQSNAQDAYEDAVSYQLNLSGEYADSATSPLKKEDLAKFKKLVFFPVDTAFRVVAQLEKTKDQNYFEMQTTTDRKPEYRLWAIAIFSLQNKEYRLNVYQNKKALDDPKYSNYLFLPFLDLTNGESSYGGGRYIDLMIPEDNTVIIDFNKAYNPYCAYNHRYSCPIVPRDNFLDVEVLAGVKKYK